MPDSLGQEPRGHPFPAPTWTRAPGSPRPGGKPYPRGRPRRLGGGGADKFSRENRPPHTPRAPKKELRRQAGGALSGILRKES